MRAFILSFAVLGGLVAGSSSHACTIPVFRYALERWNPSFYEMIVFHRGELSAEHKQLLERFDRRDTQVNLIVTLADLDQEDLREDWRTIWARQNKATEPWAVLRRPKAPPAEADLWAGPLSAESLKAVRSSPAREKLGKDLGKGISTVFIVLESGNTEKDKAVRKLLEEELPKLKKSLKLPKIDPNDPTSQIRSPLPLAIDFSVIKISRDDPKEELLRRALLAGEEGLDKVKTPIVFPIFGRGRVLAALHGDILRAEVLEEVGHFLCSECSCTVKDLNPGYDLLIDMDWRSALFPEIER